MCVKSKFVSNRYMNHSVLCDCGKCESCLQSKALGRGSKIKSHSSSGMCLFVTLTYRDDCVPYIRFQDLDVCRQLDYGSLPVYRDNDRQFYMVYKDGNRIPSFVDRPGTHIVKEYCFSNLYGTGINFESLSGLRSLTNYQDRIGVCQFFDFQNFIKRLRVRLDRNDRYEQINVPFSFYVCSEYGESTCRPHFHVLLYTSTSFQTLDLWKRAISEAWPFGDMVSPDGRERIEVAVDPSSYISTYVNCSSFVPGFLKQKAFRVKHSHSKGFGFGKDEFSFPSIIKAIDSRDLKFDRVRTLEDGSKVLDRVPYPKYVINRYFPKFKGFSRLTDIEIFDVYRDPSQLRKHQSKLEIDDKQYSCILNYLYKKQQQFLNWYSIYFPSFDEKFSSCPSAEDFAFYALNCHKLRQKNLWESLYNGDYDIYDLSTFKVFYKYDNSAQVLYGLVHSDLNDLIMDSACLGAKIHFNEYPQRVCKTTELEQLYDRCLKQRKVNNYTLTHLQKLYG